MKIKRENILDELLVLKTQNHDMKAFSLLVKRFQPALLSHAYRMTRDDEAALDVAQESWHAIARGIYKLKSPSAFKTWAFRIVNNKSANWLKEKQMERNIVGEAKVLATSDISVDESDDIAIMKLAMNELPVKNRTILSMFYLDSQSVKDIALSLSLSEGTVKSRLFYARKMLKEKFEISKTIIR